MNKKKKDPGVLACSPSLQGRWGREVIGAGGIFKENLHFPGWIHKRFLFAYDPQRSRLRRQRQKRSVGQVATKYGILPLFWSPSSDRSTNRRYKQMFAGHFVKNE